MAGNPLTLFGGGEAFPLMSLHREMNRLFEGLMRGSTGTQGGSAFLAPDVNVSETDNEIRVSAELPGVTANDVQIDLSGETLVIRGEKQLERKNEKEHFHFVERSFGSFRRVVQLPSPVDADRVQAKFENGVLSVILPRSAHQDRSRRIQVQSAGEGQAQQNIRSGQSGSEQPGSQPTAH